MDSVPLLKSTQASIGAKLVALIHKKMPLTLPEYRFGLHGNRHIGQWFEVGPIRGVWEGIIFGISGGGEITFQAVGSAGALPETSTLHYPMQGIEMNAGDRQYVAWAVKNPLDKAHSCYIKVSGEPESIIFSQFADNDEVEMYHVDMR